MRPGTIAIVVGLLAAVGYGSWLAWHRIAPAALRIGSVDDAAIGLFEQPADVWLANGRTHAEQRYSPLTQIDRSNVSRLGLAWEASLDSPRFGIEASPIVVDGVLYVSSSWSRVLAFDAKTGARLWTYDPQVKGEWLRNGCCKPVNRGVAVWKGRVYVGVFDGRLIALDANSGEEVWSADTTAGQPLYTITGAPRVVNGKVVIGNGGGDFGVRGYVSAYDARTGEKAWRFYIVPGDPRKGFEHPELEWAAQTWDPQRDWTIGGGGNAWDSFSYDPQLDLLYVGTGNGGPYDPRIRNPGGGDQLFLSSILAIKPDTGRLVWHYQTTPGDSWDFTATQNMVLADLEIGGRLRKVLMQAPKNGFFYVLDRATGALLSAEPYVRVNWAERVDVKTGRPVFTGEADYTQGVRLVFPSPYGGHGWQPMAFSPDTGLVYIPARDIGWIWGAQSATWFYEGYDLAKLTEIGAEALRAQTRGLLIAWDPVAQKAAWTVPQPGLTNGGVLTTAGGLVVQGTEDGWIRVHDAADGRVLKELFVGTGIVAPPVSYAVDGVQYIAIAAGWNGVKPAPLPPEAPGPYDNAGRLIVLELDGGPVRVAERQPRPPLLAIDAPQDAAQVAAGSALYHTHCSFCHGVSGEPGVIPDLRRMSPGAYEAFDAIVRGGVLRGNGMASFADVLSEADAAAIRAFIV
ncbi:MAG: PQQ-dependent dehydrogenase, methanol/ethanol family, partial [Gammaproteobacteria bacterium]